jgi:hypothetical protein
LGVLRIPLPAVSVPILPVPVRPVLKVPSPLKSDVPNTVRLPNAKEFDTLMFVKYPDPYRNPA